jgi:hypothetical protein
MVFPAHPEIYLCSDPDPGPSVADWPAWLGWVSNVYLLRRDGPVVLPPSNAKLEGCVASRHGVLWSIHCIQFGNCYTPFINLGRSSMAGHMSRYGRVFGRLSECKGVGVGDRISVGKRWWGASTHRNSPQQNKTESQKKGEKHGKKVSGKTSSGGKDHQTFLGFLR